MLGIRKKQKANWQWALCGKHPVARDYVRMRINGPLMTAFETWVEKGYQRISGNQADFRHLHSWRFWSKSAEKDGIICGLLKDSSDSIGRPFPLMILGSGTIDKWETQWHLLPMVLDDIWNQMEQLVSRQIDTVARLEEMILQMKSPQTSWSEAVNEISSTGTERPECTAGENVLEPYALSQHLKQLAGSQELWLPLTDVREKEPFQWACSWFNGMKQSGHPSPQMVFIGGTADSPTLVVLSRSLRPDDFQRLWQIPETASESTGEH